MNIVLLVKFSTYHIILLTRIIVTRILKIENLQPYFNITISSSNCLLKVNKIQYRLLFIFFFVNCNKLYLIVLPLSRLLVQCNLIICLRMEFLCSKLTYFFPIVKRKTSVNDSTLSLLEKYTKNFSDKLRCSQILRLLPRLEQQVTGHWIFQGYSLRDTAHRFSRLERAKGKC